MIDSGVAKTDVGVEMPPAGSGRVLSAYLLVQVGLIAGLLWKITYFQLADEVYGRITLDDPFFPDWLRSADVVRWAYLTSVGGIVLGVVGAMPWIRKICAAVVVLAATVLCVHQASYNDMTFATTFWTALWVFWFTTRMDRDESFALLDRGAFLARSIGSMILLGGAVGKWTPEYWSGEVFWDIYFTERDFWVFNHLRETYDTETLRSICTWYSRKVVAVETLAGFGMWLLPAKWAAVVGVTLFFSIAFFSNFLLYSVLASMVGLAAVGFFVASNRPTT